jgi:hypothetical protein
MDIIADAASIERFCADPSLQSFLVSVNQLLARDEHHSLSPSSDPFADCDSLELVLLGLHVEALGAELTPGIEASIASLEDVHRHVLRQLDIPS